jgi:DNA repair exonuclease SbcCD ATPase subunit/predicted phosphodiesterase
MPKILILGDTQLDSRPSRDRLDERGRSIRFSELQETLRGVIGDASDRGCSAMIHLGDLTEERNPDSATLEAAANLFGLALALGWSTYAIAGNHDGALFELTSSSFGAFGKLNKNCHVYHAPAWADLGGCAGLFIPYLHRKSPKEVMDAAIAAAGGAKMRFVFAHYSFAGAQIGANNLIIPGDVLDSSLLRAVGAEAAYFGHIHKQQVIESVCPVIFPGSPVINDFGERDDPKGYAILDTDTGKRELFPIPQRRRWIQLDWRALYDPKRPVGKPEAFGEADLVKITGAFGPGENPRLAFDELRAAGKIPEPFFKTFFVQRAAAEAPKSAISGASGLQQATADYFAARWPEDPLRAEALEAALGAIKSSSPAAFDKRVTPTGISMTDFLSHRKATIYFVEGQALLICGENGLGKTNLIEAVLFALTGKGSKGLKMASLVRQGASKASVELFLTGEKGYYKITRTIALNSKGAATHSVEVKIKPIASTGPEWADLTDGGNKDAQAALARLIGATWTSMRAINFQFQRDPNPFISADPKERKAILAEILGLDALGRALKALNEDRLTRQRTKDTAADVLAEAERNCDPATLDLCRKKLAEYQERLPRDKAWLATEDAALEAAVSAAAAVGGERTSLQAVVDSLMAQADAGAGLRAAKAAAEEAHRKASQAAQEALQRGLDNMETAKAGAEAAFQKTRTERGASYVAAKKKAEDKLALAKDLPDLQKTHAGMDVIYRQSLAWIGKDIVPEQETKIGGLALASSKAATASVDAGLAVRQAQQVKSDAHAAYSKASEALTAKKADLEALKGQDLKTCSKCGQALDTAHAEAEIARLTAEIAADLEALAAPLIALGKADEALNAAHIAEAQARIAATEAAKALSDAEKARDAAVAAAKAKAATDLQAAKASLDAALTADQDAKDAAKTRDDILAAGEAAKAEHQKALAGWDAAIAEAKANFSQAQAKEEAEHAASMAAQDTAIAEADRRGAEARAKAEEHKKTLAGMDARLLERQAAVENQRSRQHTARTNLDTTKDGIVRVEADIAKAVEYEEKARAKKAELEAATRAWSVADMACQGIKDLPAHLIDEKLPVIADYVNAYLSDFGSPEFTIAFSTRKEDGEETLDVLVDNGAEPRLDIAAYSGGQLDRIEFCVRMALGDLAEVMRDVRLGFVMMDEPGTHLDAEKKGALIRMLVGRAADGKCPVAVVVSHDPKLMSAIPNRLMVTRDGIKEYA